MKIVKRIGTILTVGLFVSLLNTPVLAKIFQFRTMIQMVVLHVKQKRDQELKKFLQ